jgi:hypothetical protein
MSESNSESIFPEPPSIPGKHINWEKLPKNWDWNQEIIAVQKAANIDRLGNLSIQFSQLGVINDTVAFFSRPAGEGHYNLRLKRYNLSPEGTYEDSSLTVLFNHIIYDHETGETEARSKEYLGHYATGIAQLIDSQSQTLPPDFTTDDIPVSMPGLMYPRGGEWHVYENPSYPGIGYNLLANDNNFEDVYRFSRASSAIAKCVAAFSAGHRE